MSDTTSVPRPIMGLTGVVLPEELDVLAGALSDINAAFGNKLNLDNKAAPHWQLAQSLTAIIGDKNNQFLYFMQMIDPLYSEGRMQDALAKIYFITRYPAQSTVVAATCRGISGTYIPAGTLARTVDNTLYNCVSGGTIGADGTVVLAFQCNTVGPIVCGENALNQVGQSIPGWDSITNLSDGVVGQLSETPSDFEARRYASVAQNGQGSVPNVRGAVLSVAGVLDAYVTDNPTGAAISLQGVSIGANTLYVAVAGGSDNDVAQAIQTKKSPGCNMQGNTIVTVEDLTYPDEPRPTYTIQFQRATPVAIKMLITVKNTPNTPTDAIAQIQQAIITAFASSVRARIGGTVFAMRFAIVVASLGTWASEVVDISVDTTTPASAKTITLNLDQIPAISAADITVVLS